MNYTLAVRLEDPPHPTCVACGGQITRIHTVITKQPDNLTGVVCGPCIVGADPNLSHRADRILSQGWKPVLS